MAATDTPATGAKAKLDDTELSDDLPKALQKVDLDLDDAPFLEDEKPEEKPKEKPSASSETPVKVKEAQPASNKKLLLIIGIAGLVVVGALVFFLTRKPAAPPSPPKEEQPAPEPVPEPTPPPPSLPEPPAPKPEIVMPMEPFLVEMTDSKGRSRFLTIRFTAVTQEKTVEQEFKRNLIVVRDAVYYYLKNKNMEFLTDKNNTDALKKDVLSVINQFIGPQPLDNLLIEDFLVK